MLKLFFIAALSFLCYSCMKVPIPVIDNASTTDPNISFFDNYTVALETYKLDSFLTSGSGTFAAGFHKDPLFGVINASAYVQVELPSDNPIKDKNVSFDSLEIILTPNGNYYGDTLAPYKIEAYKLLEKIENEDAVDNNFYNPRNFSYDPVLLGSTISVIRPKRGTNIKIRLSDNMGQELLMKLKNNHTDIQDNKSFINYFKGLYFKTDTSFSRTVYYFKPHLTNSILRLHYHLNGVFSEEKVLDFPISNAKQFNNIHINYSSTQLSVFAPYKDQLKKSNLTGSKAYLNNLMPSYVKMSFPTILQLKELYPYIKVMKAELVITPAPGTYRYPYTLPNTLHLYTTDDNNNFNIQLTDNFTQEPLTGNLSIDELYGDKTNYSFDITGFINTIIEEGKFSKQALMLVPAAGYSDQLQRLVINDQTQPKGIQLKLYLLGI